MPGVSAELTADQLFQIMPCAETNAASNLAALNAAMATNGILTIPNQAAFLAQISVESADLRCTEENLDYAADRLTEVWPTHFPTPHAARPYAHNPEKLANFVYANRMGNGSAASGDGYRFRGRGFLQITGRDNYAALGYANNPDAPASLPEAAQSAASFWVLAGLNHKTETVLDRAAFDAITRIVSGCTATAPERFLAYQRALRALHPSPSAAQEKVFFF
jgi:putative chitinase